MLVNLTPHKLNIVTQNRTIDLPPSGEVARLKVSRQFRGWLGDIPLHTPTLGGVEGLPPEKEGVRLIVSALVAEAFPKRGDLLYPGELLRDEEGRVIGCNGLSKAR